MKWCSKCQKLYYGSECGCELSTAYFGTGRPSDTAERGQ